MWGLLFSEDKEGSGPERALARETTDGRRKYSVKRDSNGGACVNRGQAPSCDWPRRRPNDVSAGVA